MCNECNGYCKLARLEFLFDYSAIPARPAAPPAAVRVQLVHVVEAVPVVTAVKVEDGMNINMNGEPMPPAYGDTDQLVAHQTMRSSVEGPPPSMIAIPIAVASSPCPRCGLPPVTYNDHFCRQCGATLTPGDTSTSGMV